MGFPFHQLDGQISEQVDLDRDAGWKFAILLNGCGHSDGYGLSEFFIFSWEQEVKKLEAAYLSYLWNVEPAESIMQELLAAITNYPLEVWNCQEPLLVPI